VALPVLIAASSHGAFIKWFGGETISQLQASK
jgi:hypothetical protein